VTTKINIVIDQNGLLNKDNLQRMVNRKALEIMEKRKQLEKEALEKLKAERRAQGLDPDTGKPLPSAPDGALDNASADKYDPAANRLIRSGAFGLYRVIPGVGDEGAVELVLPPDSSIEFKELSSLAEVSNKFSVIWVGTRVECYQYSRQTWFGSYLSRLVEFARSGGIVVINSEWSVAGCAVGFGNLDNDINSAFGTTMRQNIGELDFQEGPVGVNLVSGRSPFMPTVAMVNASGTWSNGTPLYVGTPAEGSGSFITSAYQKVGAGVLVRWADSNEVGDDPLKRLSANGRGVVVSMAEGLIGWQRSGVI
jgi:hypothetical protein